MDEGIDDGYEEDYEEPSEFEKLFQSVLGRLRLSSAAVTIVGACGLFWSLIRVWATMPLGILWGVTAFSIGPSLIRFMLFRKVGKPDMSWNDFAFMILVFGCMLILAGALAFKYLLL